MDAPTLRDALRASVCCCGRRRRRRREAAAASSAHQPGEERPDQETPESLLASYRAYTGQSAAEEDAISLHSHVGSVYKPQNDLESAWLTRLTSYFSRKQPIRLPDEEDHDHTLPSRGSEEDDPPILTYEQAMAAQQTLASTSSASSDTQSDHLTPTRRSSRRSRRASSARIDETAGSPLGSPGTPRRRSRRRTSPASATTSTDSVGTSEPVEHEFAQPEEDHVLTPEFWQDPATGVLYRLEHVQPEESEADPLEQHPLAHGTIGLCQVVTTSM
ncbi:uncharacterized protein L969DRAFT_96435 [Mixia osmundae IAM 14324]|uniref:Uncharacterized protein n=1 Tax=Mixia osmundae (strain CBS 9802 / IAM 14324 / JCM 22182 / KY 12970) TaxID=764103 RepID=G7DWJ5_MIXOS|nr:uncharacterized protein L969DRAFT_96435 [Mixia osmundae IAM 14324]KEI37356.1 hypothetical protein L969DRAFT_96435 [Mixia osmundae IAM 14324]GAA94955.1 hypothetical protein E5Q_01610 [Mixia osmundae IAM 14324]